MATQDKFGVPFTKSQVQHTFRLLELPDSLLDLLSSSNPPILSVKSKPAPPSAIVQAQKESYACLCTPNKTFQLRQVHTSNSVLVAESSAFTADHDGIPVPAISAIAQCGSMLELQPVSDSPIPYLKEMLAEWDDQLTNGGAQDLKGGPSTSKSKEEVFADVPFSDEECDQAWVEICAFDCNGVPSYPSPRTPWTYWKAIYSLSMAESINLGSQFQVRDVEKQLEEDGLSPQLVRSILRRLLPNDQVPEQDWTVIDKAKCVPWVGRHLLIALDSRGGVLQTADFLDQWRDALPETWRASAALETIKDDYVLPTDHCIAPKQSLLTQYKSASFSAGKTAEKSATKPSARKWHERFKASRRQP